MKNVNYFKWGATTVFIGIVIQAVLVFYASGGLLIYGSLASTAFIFAGGMWLGVAAQKDVDRIASKAKDVR